MSRYRRSNGRVFRRHRRGSGMEGGRVERTSARRIVALALGVWLLGGWSVAAAAEGLRIEYQRTGVVPGSEEKSTAQQRLTADATGSRLVFEDFRPDGTVKYVLRADQDPLVVYEILPDQKSYREHAGDLVDVQKERTITEQNEVELANRLSRKDREAFYREFWWLRPSGAREVQVERSAGEVVLGRQCDHIVVTENGRTIIDGQIAGDVPGARSYFQLYRRLGAFSDQVLERLASVEGVLLRGRITVVTSLRAHDFELEATSLEPVVPAPGIFSVDGLRKVESSPKDVGCPVCEKVVDPKRATKGFYEGQVLHFCSEECADEYKRLRKSRRGKSAAGGGREERPARRTTPVK